MSATPPLLFPSRNFISLLNSRHGLHKLGPACTHLYFLIASALLPSIYSVVFRALQYLTLGQAIVMLLVVLVGLAFWMNPRGRQEW